MADIAKFIEEIKGMTVVELNTLVKAIEEEFGVSAAAVAVAGPAAGGDAAPAVEEKTEFNVVTVSGLLTGRDIAAQLDGVELGERLLLSRSCLKADEDIFLCDMTSDELSERLSTPLVFCDESGYSLFSAITGIEF